MKPDQIKTRRKPSCTQLKALDNLAAGRVSSFGLRGQAAHGGHQNVLRALCKRGWIKWVAKKGYTITDEGRSGHKKHFPV